MATKKDLGAYVHKIEVGYIPNKGFKTLETKTHEKVCTVHVTEAQKSNLHIGQHVTVVKGGFLGFGVKKYLAGYGRGSAVASSIKGKVLTIPV